MHIPDAFTNSLTIQTAAGTYDAAEITTTSATSVEGTLTVDTHKYVATIWGDFDAKQIFGSYDISAIYNRQSVGLLGDALEASIFGLQSSVSTNTVNDTASVVNDTDLRLAIEKLESANVPRDEIAWFFHPYTYYAQILAVQKYYDASQAGWQGESGPTISGNFGNTAASAMSRKGTLFGIPLFTSSNVVNTLLATKNLLAHNTAFTFATQTAGGGRIRVQGQNMIDRLGFLTVWDIAYGVAETREAAATLINGSNAFIAS